jgi:hypothetical protein
MRDLGAAVFDLAALLARIQPSGEGLVDGVEIQNDWGYTSAELRLVLLKVHQVVDPLRKMGLDDLVPVNMVLDRNRVKNGFAFYSREDDIVYLSPERTSSALTDLTQAVADRVWIAWFTSGNRSTWGTGTRAWDNFRRAWQSLLSGTLDGLDLARMTSTVGVMVGRDAWDRVVRRVAA